MTKIQSSPETGAILAYLQQHRTASRLELEQHLGLALGKRALLNRLNTLKSNGFIGTEGAGRALRYHLVKPQEGQITERKPQVLSEQATRIIHYIKKPVDERRPIGYNTSLLEDYQPNETYYLPEATRTYLAKIGRPTEPSMPAGTYARTLYDRLLIDLTWNSSRLEGNTYSILDTRRLLAFGHQSDSQTDVETQMILNHKAAIEYLVENPKELDLNRFLILNLHAMLSDNLLENPQASGRLRSISVGISQSTFLPLDSPPLIAQYFTTLIEKAGAIDDLFEQSFFLLVHLPYLQPFDDVNKQVARLAANIPFIVHNFNPISFIDMPTQAYLDAMLGIYELNNWHYLLELYVQSYERSVQQYRAVRQSLGEPDPFRLQYTTHIKQLVHGIIQNTQDRPTAFAQVTKYAQNNIPAFDQAQFRATVETELLALHEGNFARYKVTPKVFFVWKAVWGDRI